MSKRRAFTNSDAYPDFGRIMEAFIASPSGAPFFILDPEKDLDIVYENPAARSFFQLADQPSQAWFRDIWPEAQDQHWRNTLIQDVTREKQWFITLPKALTAHTGHTQELTFSSFYVDGIHLLAGAILNVDSRARTEYQDASIKQALEKGDFYHTILANLHDSMGLFEFDEQRQLRVVWLNERAYRYVEPIKNASQFLVLDLIPKSIHKSWKQFEETLLTVTERTACSFLVGEGVLQHAFDIYFTPVNSINSSRKQLIANWHNMTKLFQREKANSQQQQDFYNLVENAPDIIIRYDQKGRRTYANRMFERVTGVKRSDVIGLTPEQYSGIGASAAKIQALVDRTITTRSMVRETITIDTVTTPNSVYEVRSIPEFDHSEEILGVLLVARDITQQVKATERTKISEELFRTLVENSPDYICRYDLDCRLEYSNPVLSKLFDCNMEDMIGNTPTELRDNLYRRYSQLVPKDESPLHTSLKSVIRTQKGQECEISAPTIRGEVHSFVSITPEFDPSGKLHSLLVIGRDVTELKEYQERVSYLSKYDTLTGLPNRTTLLNKVRSQLGQYPLMERKVGLLVLGIDHFKNINESLGYEYGDIVLKALTQRLQSIAPRHATLARIGGDEFGVFISSVRNRETFTSEAESISKSLTQPIVVGNREVNVSVSIGACLYPDDAQDLEDLVRYADSALYAAKSNQRSSIHFYSHELTQRAKERMELRNSLRTAINEREFLVYLQPKVNIATGKLMGAEALVRWQHPTKGMIYPDAFVPIAEELGLICDIDMIVLDKLCEYLHQWGGCIEPEQRFAVNLSAVQFKRDHLVSDIDNILKQNGCYPQSLELEITEGVLLEHSDGLATTINSLKNLGVTIALDDFGTGYSSLSYLSRYPIDTLKIDRSFINDIAHSSSSSVLVRTIVSMAHNLGMTIVAEGVEDQEQALLLKEFGVEVAQGYYYARPMPIEEFSRQYFPSCF